MIGLLVAAIALLPFAFDASRAPKFEPPCPADTVWIHLHMKQEWLGGIPVEMTDTTWVIRSWEEK